MSGLIEQQRFMCSIGAMQSVVAIPRALPILHSGPGCGTMVAGFFERSTGYSGGYTAPCTNFSETEVIFGGVQKLENLIRHSYKVLDSDLQVVLTGCTASIVGDDAGQVVKQFAAEGKPIVYADTPGFKYTNYESHSVIVNAIIDQYTARFNKEKKPTDPKLVNLFASIPYQDPFWKGNLEEYKRLIEGIGLKVQVLFGPHAQGTVEWQNIPRANFNILISPWYGRNIAEHLQEKYDQSYFQFPYIPIGGNETTRFLRGLALYANEHGAELENDAVETFIKKEEETFYEEIDNLATFLLEFRYGLPSYVHILHDASYVLGMARFLLHETGIVPKEQFITDKTPEEYQQNILDIGGSISDKKKIPLYFQADAGLAQETILAANHEGRGLIIGSGWDKDLARKKNCDFLSAALPSPYRLVMTSGYAGYRGGLRLIEDIYNQALSTYR
ncbi:nitrogenase component 1 [Treponema primitia]|uniref:nitrogenase component 1 n=1 Tax=Treponema primitia TaxID=88058 RepID=UPI000255582A|nr:nitrogenase component 1 [Treponema primitia]